jgi:hypothetical protein
MSAGVTYEAHPLAALIPSMSADEYTRLRDDVAANGLLDAIVLHEGQVLDGRHRLRACEDTDTEPIFTEYDGDSPAQFVLSHNLHRRHLSVSQRAMVATDFLPHLMEEAKARQVAHLRQGITTPSVSKETNGGRAREHAAEVVGVSHAVIGRAKRVVDNEPDLAQRVREGEMTVGAAHDEVKRRQAGISKPKQESGQVTARSVQRIAEQAASLEMSVGAIALTKSCSRLTADERDDALEKCKKGRKAINALVNALLAASEKE